MKFLLVGHDGCYNRGCEAILRTTITMLREEFGESEIVISAFDYKNDKLLVDFGQNIKFIPAQLKNIWKRWTWQWGLRQIYKIYSKAESWKMGFLPISSAIKWADIVISVGGDNYTMDYSSPDYFFNLNRLVKEKKKKLVIWGASIGPFPQDEKIGEIIDNLRLADLITIRETRSFDYLSQLGITANVKLVADPAFLLPLESAPFEKVWPNTSKSILGVNISPLLDRCRKKNNKSEVLTEIISFLHKIINKPGFHILLIPHVMKVNGFYTSDYFFMEKIYEQLKNTKMITMISQNYNTMQLKYVISKCRFFIGARTHSTIAALSTKVPTLSLGYSLKAKGINKDIFGSYDFLLDINEFTAENLSNKFNKILAEEAKIKSILSKRIPEIKKMAKMNVTYLKEILQSKCQKLV